MSDGAADSLLQFTAGDRRAADLLRRNLVGLRDQLADQPGARSLRHDIEAVLAGRMTMRELAGSPALRAITDDGMRQAQVAWADLSPEERAALIAAGDELSGPATGG